MGHGRFQLCLETPEQISRRPQPVPEGLLPQGLLEARALGQGPSDVAGQRLFSWGAWTQKPHLGACRQCAPQTSCSNLGTCGNPCCSPGRKPLSPREGTRVLMLSGGWGGVGVGSWLLPLVVPH